MKRRKRMTSTCQGACVRTMEEKQTSFGWATYVRVYRNDDAPMSWREVWEAFQRVYPGKWACEFFPPASELIDEANVYHLYVLEEEPRGVNIRKNPYNALAVADGQDSL